MIHVSLELFFCSIYNTSVSIIGFNFRRHGLLIVFDSLERNLIKERNDTFKVLYSIAHLFLERLRLTRGRRTLDSGKICLQIGKELLELRKELLKDVLVIVSKLADEVRVGQDIRQRLGNDLAACLVVGHLTACVLLHLYADQLVRVYSALVHSIKNYFS